MPFPYYAKLSRADRAIYRKSDRIPVLRLPRVRGLRERARRLRAALAAEDRPEVELESRVLARAITDAFEVPPVRVKVYAVRPTRSWGELYALYHPAEGRARARIDLWMRTARKHQVVAWRTFLRTLAHELCHHLDYELLELPDSFHTEGFFQRESSLFRQIVGAPLNGEPARSRASASRPRRAPRA